MCKTESIIPVSIFCILLILVSGCSKKFYPYSFSYAQLPEVPDYQRLEHWAAHPDKWDPSDRIPAPFRKQAQPPTGVDVFFIHPTTYTEDTANSLNASINDSLLNLKTDRSSILYQASAFQAGTRVFAPRYRQAHYKCFFLSDTTKAKEAFELAYLDVERAFEYYLLHYNNKHPFIIAAHSQGTVHAAKLLKKFIEGKELARSMVAAYLVGMPVPSDYFQELKACTNPGETGCILSWRTFKTGYTDTVYVSKEAFKAIVTNPLTWDTSSELAPRQLNKGGILKRFNRLKKGVVSAQVHGNVLWSSKPRFFGNFLLKQKNYHIGDINLFYANIRENMLYRIRNWNALYKP